MGIFVQHLSEVKDRKRNSPRSILRKASMLCPEHLLRRMLVELFDLMSTFLEMASVRPEYPHFGRNLRSLMMGGASEHRDSVFCESGHPAERTHAFDPIGPPENPYYAKMSLPPITFSKAVMVRTRGRKLIWRYTGKHELYDLRSDARDGPHVFRRRDG